MSKALKLVIVILFVFGFAPCLRSQRDDVQAYQVTISWRIMIDDANEFNFKNLTVLVQHRVGKDQPWAPVGPLTTPDNEGRFIATVAAGEWVSVGIATADPTIRRVLDKPNALDNYTLGDKVRETVLDQEVYVKSGTPRTLEKVIQLQRGAAFTICVPPSVRSGSIQFYPVPLASKKVNVISFSDSRDTSGEQVGGLMPGSWVAKYVDEKGSVVLSQDLNLVRGALLETGCPSKSNGNL